MICSVCQSTKYYAKSLCKKCYKKQWHLQNRNSELKKSKDYHLKNIEKENSNSREWYLSNKGYHRLYYRRTNVASKVRRRYRTDQLFKLSCILRARFQLAFKNNNKSGSVVRDLGCSIEFLKQYLESKFYPNPITNEQMTWDNYGDWEIDHIKPFCHFDLTDKNQVLIVCNYSNLQPLWPSDHVRKTKEDMCKAKLIQEK